MLLFAAAALHLRARDTWFGWSDEQRRRRLAMVVNNVRFLLMPERVVPNLGSVALSRVLARLNDDWQARYDHPVLIVETFVDPARFQGTVYRAAGWTELVRTQGRAQRRATAITTALCFLCYLWEKLLAFNLLNSLYDQFSSHSDLEMGGEGTEENIGSRFFRGVKGDFSLLFRAEQRNEREHLVSERFRLIVFLRGRDRRRRIRRHIVPGLEQNPIVAHDLLRERALVLELHMDGLARLRVDLGHAIFHLVIGDDDDVHHGTRGRSQLSRHDDRNG